ncbi:unnamed protein product [Spirodela intermedia]|uniref:non-specific serine/threonine protein kinase n=1 Tax=Spirodela intermedia TaxID=51605 RepID=A0A7I8I7J3_SPIIN|nr:unnamed protein product [Spirodela intermedia]CAA6653499.1 unnamed protein product [Spirodela intermedia]
MGLVDFCFVVPLLLLLGQQAAAGRAPRLPEDLALLSVRASLTDPSGALDSWKAATDHCGWEGVACDPVGDGAVVSLDLAGRNLSGVLSPEVGRLRSLLNLFPTALSRLRNLQVLDLYNNNLTGDLPAELFNTRNLRHLHLGGNYFTGSIPPEYGRWEFLQYLALSGNELTGPIPPEIGNLTRLQELYIGYFNMFTGGIPPEIGNLSALVRLDVANCGITGEIPPEIGKLENLDTLFLQVNGLTGELSPELGKLRSLKSMDLSNNALTGGIPSSFSEFKNLTLLNLFRNRLHGSIPDFIGDLPKLEVLQLWENNFTGSVPQQLGSNKMLQVLDLSSNKLTGNIPRDLCSGNRLQTLIALGNFLFGPIPDSLGRCESLGRIRLGDNYLNGSIPDGLFSLPNLLQVELQNNLLSGGFPETRGSAISPNLGQISLSNNKLTGPLPESIGNFSGVQKLLLNQNLLSGGIPRRSPACSNYRKWTSAGTDSLRNDLSGGIPEEISAMRILNYLNLSRNHLSGGIPSSISTMQSLTSVDFSYNNLSGLVPGNGQFSYFNSSSFVGNPDLCGPYLGPCRADVVPDSQAAHGKGRFTGSFKLLLVIGLLICSIAFAVAAIFKARSLKKASGARAWKLTAFQRLDFTSDDVLACLKEENVIGKGGAGVVYKGVMPNGDQVAVKRLPVMSRGSSHDHGFSAEIQTLGRIRHRHIVRLLGFCSNHETNLLVYEYLPNGSLGEVLHGKKGGHLEWDTRYKIALEAAKGLCYLHHDCSPLILHRDVKSNNILLDSNFEAHVADFGLAKFLQGSGTSECMSAIAGSYGYIAPVDEKSDVYSFGVVLLELITGRKPVGEFGDGVDIVLWARKMTGSVKEEVLKILDLRLPNPPLHELMHVFYVAMLCVEEQSIERPTMREVVQMLAELPRAVAGPDQEGAGDSSGESAPAAAPPQEEEHGQQQQPPPPLPGVLLLPSHPISSASDPPGGSQIRADDNRRLHSRSLYLSSVTRRAQLTEGGPRHPPPLHSISSSVQCGCFNLVLAESAEYHCHHNLREVPSASEGALTFPLPLLRNPSKVADPAVTSLPLSLSLSL